MYARDQGLFKRYGLDAEVLVVAGGSRAVPALTSGSVEFCHMAGGPAANAVAAGADLVIVGSLLDRFGYALMVSNEIKTPADLKGKALAVSTPGSASAIAMNIVLDKLGLQPDVDVTVLAIGDYAARVAALDSRYVAGSVFDYPELARIRARGYRMMFDMAPLNLPTIQIALVTSRTFLKTNRPTVIRFMKAISHALTSVRHDRSGAIAALAKYADMDPIADAAVLAQTYEEVYAGRLKRTPAISIEGVRTVVEEAKRNHPGATGLSAESLVDLTVVQELEDSGFFKTLDE